MTATKAKPAVNDSPRFTAPWETRPIGDCGQVIAGKALNATGPGARRSYLRTVNVLDGEVRLDDVLQMPMTDAEFQRYVLREGDVLLNEGQSLELVGRCAIVPAELDGRFAIQNQLVRFRAFDGTSPSFATYLFRHFQATGVFQKISLQTTSVAHLGVSRFARLEATWPPEPEQRAIAAALSDVDDLLQSLDRLIAKKRDVKQGAMQQLLTGTTRLPGFEGDWVTTRLGGMGDCVRGVGYDPERDLRAYDTEETFRLLRSTNVQGGRLVLDDLQFVDQSRVSTAQEMRDGDLLFCAANGSRALVGKSAAFTVNDGHRYTFGAFMGVFRPRVEAADSAFVEHLLQSRAFFGQVDLALSGSAINNLSPSAVESFQFSWPRLPEQRAIAAVLSDMDAEIDALEDRRAKTAAIKQGMMQELLTGRTRLPVPQEA